MTAIIGLCAAGTRALTTAATYSLARSQGYRPRTPTTERPACRIEGVDEPISLIVLHS